MTVSNNIALKIHNINDFFDTESMTGNDDRKELIILRKLNMKPVSIYLVNEDFINDKIKKILDNQKKNG